MTLSQDAWASGGATPGVSAKSHLIQLFQFGLVGISGLVVNTVALVLWAGVLDFHYLAGIVFATQMSTLWNYSLSDRWVFDSEGNRFSGWARFGQFWAMNNAALLLRGPMVWILTEGLAVHYVVSNLLSLVVFMLVRYALSSQLIWQTDRTAAVATPTRPQRSPQTASGAPTRRTDRAAPADAEDPSPKTSTHWLMMVAVFVMVAVPAIVLRVAYLDSLGFNSDEAVYAGQAASISGDDGLLEYFPIFRAHPLLFQSSLSLVYSIIGVSPLIGRLTAVTYGLATVGVTYLLGRQLYGRRAGAIAALIIAVMPYHVVVSRQVLLDGPMVLFSTLIVYSLARYAAGRGRANLWLYAAAGMFGLTFLTNERSIVLLGAVYLFFAMSPNVVIRVRQMVLGMAIIVGMMLPYPMSVFFSGKSTTGEQFLAWQLFRRANHTWTFYPTEVPAAMGYLTVIAAIAAIVMLWRARSWREVLLGAFIGVPLLFFQIWPVKGFQYLLSLAPLVAVLAGYALDQIPDRLSTWVPRREGRILRVLAVAVVVGVLINSSWTRITPADAGEEFLAGSGGVPGGRSAGEWVLENVPEGGRLLAIGPSMANIIQWYGDRKTFGLSVSPNPLHRNPVYEPINNPDLLLRNGDLHYLVWDSFSAGRTEFFSNKLLVFAERYNGRIVHQEFVNVSSNDGQTVRKPVIVIYEVRP